MAMAHEAGTQKTRFLWQFLTILTVLLSLVQLGGGLTDVLSHHQGKGVLGDSEGACDPHGFCPVIAVAPDTPMARAGIRAGDRLRFDDPLNYRRPPNAGETVGITLQRGSAEIHMNIVAAQQPWTASDKALEGYVLMFVASGLITVLLGAFVIVRSHGRASSLLLGAAFAAIYVVDDLPWWLNSPALFWWVNLAIGGLATQAPLLIPAFARQFRRELTGGDGIATRLALCVVAAGTLLRFAEFVWSLSLGDMPQAIYAFTSILNPCVEVAGFLLAAAILLAGWREVGRDQRGRFTLLMIAVALTAAIRPLGFVNGLLSNNGAHLSVNLIFAPMIAFASIAGGLLFAYAVLRQRVIDIGFAVNQTLVYGVVSFLVLLAFGLAEWGIEKIMPEAWREHMEANAFISAGIALVIFLLFHRIRDIVEHLIEGVFFHKWRQNEAQLQRFIRKAAHILKPDALKAAAVAEFARFSGGAEVALYRAEATGLTRDAGGITGLDATLDGDLEPLVTLRAEGKPLFAEDAEALHAALVLPMIQRNDLTGFIALGPKPSGDAYRPDERAALAEAAQKIGLDLRALRIEELQQANAELGAQLKLALKLA